MNEVTIILLVHGVTVLVGVFLGFKIAMYNIELDERDRDADIWEEERTPFIEKIFSKGEEVPVIDKEEVFDKEKSHVFYD